MGEISKKRKRTGAAKMSRHKKAYWRKGANVEDIEESFAVSQAEKEANTQLADTTDDNLFIIDRDARVEEVETKKNFTKRQDAALKKISVLVEGDVDRQLSFPKKPKNKLTKLPGRQVIVEKPKEKKKKETYDVWGTDLNVKLDVHEAAVEGGQFYLKQTKKVISKKPKTLNMKPSLLKAVEVPDAGASYNPEVTEYAAYVKTIAENEMKIIADEQALEKSLAVDASQLVTPMDRIREDAEGIFDTETETLKEELSKLEHEEEAESFLTGPVENNMKTRRERAKAKAHKEKLKKALEAKLLKQAESKLFKSKKIIRELVEKEKTEAAAATKRLNRKKLDDVSKRKKLGRGKFEEQETPFLLQDELVGNLRQLKPQGSLLEDRMKSMQKRNMLPIAGERNTRRLKKKLKVKHIEKRTHQQVTLGYKPK